ncbi:MAG: ribonuclease H-like domain-containing protein [Lachnospiraceae bacterium]|nr:ribonuclease H-like domain-containing protein [Lachnospiraceae bacterium]
MRIMEENFPIIIQPKMLPDEASHVVFFDIETTGFSGQSSLIYLIGCIYYKDNSWQLRQWFLDDVNTEKELLLSFFDFIGSYTWLIHFNGAAFDIPFIEKRLARPPHIQKLYFL